jgi:hypothetical protein
MILNARVKEVMADKVVYTTKDPKTGEMSEHEVDSGFTLWSTGIGKLFSLIILSIIQTLTLSERQ